VAIADDPQGTGFPLSSYAAQYAYLDVAEYAYLGAGTIVQT